MIRRLWIVLALLIAVPAYASDEVAETSEVTIVTEEGAQHIFHLEVAQEWQNQEKGLMFRPWLAEDGGMLFVFSQSQERGFWMKNTFIPLDIMFVTSAGIIHKIHHRAIPEDLTVIRSEGPAQFVIEIKGGMAEKLGISTGDKVYNRDHIGNELAE